MLRVLMTASAVAALLSSVVILWVRETPLSNLLALLIAVASPYAPLLALSGLLLAASSRRRVLAAAAVVIVAATLAVQASSLYGAEAEDVGQHVDVRLISANLRRGQADAAFVVGLANANTDVIAVSELTPEAVLRFSQAGIDDEFPHSLLLPAPGAGGMGLWSRFPLVTIASPPSQDVGIVTARLQVPGVRFNPLVGSVHITSPVASETDSFGKWQNGINSTGTQLTDFAEAAGPAAVIIGGDFNSTLDMRQFRDLLTNGYRDGVEQAGAGFAPTFPSGEWFPPLIAIDHVLVRNAQSSSIRTLDIPGSDHRALLGNVRVPADPTASEAP